MRASERTRELRSTPRVDSVVIQPTVVWNCGCGCVSCAHIFQIGCIDSKLLPFSFHPSVFYHHFHLSIPSYLLPPPGTYLFHFFPRSFPFTHPLPCPEPPSLLSISSPHLPLPHLSMPFDLLPTLNLIITSTFSPLRYPPPFNLSTSSFCHILPILR